MGRKLLAGFSKFLAEPWKWFVYRLADPADDLQGVIEKKGEKEGGNQPIKRKRKTPSCLTMTAFSGASKRVRTSGLPLRRRPLYPAELWMRMKDEGYYTLIEMMGEFSEAGEPVPIRRRTLYPAELWVQILRHGETASTVL